MANKFGARSVDYDGYRFDSLKEERRYQELKLLERAGEIMSLDVHPTYLLQERFRYNGKWIQAITYTPDFRYIERGVTVVEDVKGIDNNTGKVVTVTEVFAIKAKIFKFLNPFIDFRMV